MTYQSEITNIPIPSSEQIEQFKKHLLTIHSWYKHLSIELGNNFVIFLEPDLDRNYTTKQVMYPWNVNTKEQYLKAYGHLSYMWYDSNIWNQDGGKARTNIPSYLIDKWSVKLYPYCHEEFDEAISLLRVLLNSEKKKQIPNYKKLVMLENKITIRDHYWNNKLNDAEREMLASIDDDASDFELKKLSYSAQKYNQLVRQVWPILTALKSIEEKKIDVTIHLLLEDVKKIKQNCY